MKSAAGPMQDDGSQQGKADGVKSNDSPPSWFADRKTGSRTSTATLLEREGDSVCFTLLKP